MEGNPTDAVVFFWLSLLLGVASRHVLRGSKVPYTVALLVIGIALGAIDDRVWYKSSTGEIGDGIRMWSRIDPDLLLAVFLPALLFESSFSMEAHQIKLAFPYNWNWKTSLLLGGLLGATDPVAVLALLKELGTSKKMSTIIEGESVMNDGIAIVVYQLFYRMVLGESSNGGTIVQFLTQVSLGAVGIGLAYGIASIWWLGFIFMIP